MLPKSFGVWNVLATPRAVISCGRKRSIRSPRSRISPASARYRPESKLTVVVLPEPLGPMGRGPRRRGRRAEDGRPPRGPRTAWAGRSSGAAIRSVCRRLPSHQRLPEPLDLDHVAVGIAYEGVVDPVRRIVRRLLDELDAPASEMGAPVVDLVRDQR